MKTPDGKEYPKKLFYRIREVGKITDVKPYVLRYWESEFPELKPEKDEHDQRRYRKEDIELIFRIKALLHEERYTIAGARRQLVQERKKGKSTKKESAPRTRANSVAEKQVKKIRRELRSIKTDLQSLVSFLEKK